MDSPVWTQTIADVLGRNLLINDVPESSSRGAVLLALETLGKTPSVTKVLTPGRKAEFDEKRHSIYNSQRKRHEEFYLRILSK